MGTNSVRLTGSLANPQNLQGNNTFAIVTAMGVIHEGKKTAKGGSGLGRYRNRSFVCINELILESS
jgi:hypothetical protein